MVTPNLCCIPKAPACRLDIRVATSVVVPLAHDENWTSGSFANIRAIGAIFACKTHENLYIGGLGRAGPVCRRAFVRFKEIMAVRTSFLLDILRDLSERSGGQQQNFFAHHGLPAVSGSPSCPRLQVPDPGLIPTACTDGEDRFGAESPATGSNLENPVRPTPAPGGQDLRSAVLPAFVKRKVRTAGRNRRFPDVKTDRQPERACSGSSG
jgi:hypothetical protein